MAVSCKAAGWLTGSKKWGGARVGKGRVGETEGPSTLSARDESRRVHGHTHVAALRLVALDGLEQALEVARAEALAALAAGVGRGCGAVGAVWS